MHQSKPDNSIIADRSGEPPTNETLLSTEIHFKNKLNGTQQKQLPAPINHLKEEPSAPQSLSIFDSTQTKHKMHNRRRPVVETAICA
jgi:hypothetical protein